MINTSMNGATIDQNLKAVYEAENEDNNDKILYIHQGELAFDTYDNLFRYSFASGPRFINRSRILRLGVKGILSENTW